MNHNEYDETIAHHYAMYRPSLHELILSKCILADKVYPLGLDIGCGAGHSTLALSKYCDKVIGMDPSVAMINSARQHAKTTYKVGSLNELVFEDDQFDLITFAGSLFYAKSQSVLDKLNTIGKSNALIIVYDFEIHLDNFLQSLIGPTEKTQLQMYNHKEDFTGLQSNNLYKLNSSQEQTQLSIDINNLTHLLLSSKQNYSLLNNNYGPENIERNIQYALKLLFPSKSINTKASLYWTKYEIRK
jgi:ubiquinone/menaquinone biosynthesis C-methylase UbiE